MLASAQFKTRACRPVLPASSRHCAAPPIRARPPTRLSRCVPRRGPLFSPRGAHPRSSLAAPPSPASPRPPRLSSVLTPAFLSCVSPCLRLRIAPLCGVAAAGTSASVQRCCVVLFCVTTRFLSLFDSHMGEEIFSPHPAHCMRRGVIPYPPCASRTQNTNSNGPHTHSAGVQPEQHMRVRNQPQTTRRGRAGQNCAAPEAAPRCAHVGRGTVPIPP